MTPMNIFQPPKWVRKGSKRIVRWVLDVGKGLNLSYLYIFIIHSLDWIFLHLFFCWSPAIPNSTQDSSWMGPPWAPLAIVGNSGYSCTALDPAQSSWGHADIKASTGFHGWYSDGLKLRMPPCLLRFLTVPLRMPFFWPHLECLHR